MDTPRVTVADLIEKLQKLDPEAAVTLYGDYMQDAYLQVDGDTVLESPWTV